MAALALLDGLAALPATAAAATAAPPAAAAAFGALLQRVQAPEQVQGLSPPTGLESPPTATPLLKPASSKPLPSPPRAAAGLPMDSTADLSLMVDALLSGKPQGVPTAKTEQVSDSTAEPLALTSPEQFLQWLAAIKQPALPQPACTSADAAALPTLNLTQVAVTVPPGVLASTTERAAPEMAIASLPSPGSGSPPPLVLTAAPLPNELQPASVIANPGATINTALALDSPDWPQRLGEQIQWRLGEGVQEARIEISPRELGTVQLHLSMDDSGLRVHLSAAHAQTRELLQNELPRLREVLQQGGVLLADAQVGREAPGQQQGRHASNAARPGRLDDDSEPLVVARSGWSSRRGLLDDYA